MADVISTEDFKQKKQEEQKENSPKISGIHPERSKMLADQINHTRVQNVEENQPSQSGLNEMIKRFRRSRKYRGYGLVTKVCRFDEETCVMSCRILDKDGKVISQGHAAWDKELMYSAHFRNCDEEEIAMYMASANRDRMEMTENIAISRALRMLGI